MTRAEKNKMKKAVMLTPLLLIVAVFSLMFIDYLQSDDKPDIGNFVKSNLKESALEVIPFVVGIITSILIQIKNKI